MKLKTILAAAVSFAGLSTMMNAEPLTVGAPAPEITAVDQDGKEVNLKDVYAKGPTLVYFYPKADTSGCTKQGCSLRDSWSDLQGKKIQVLGVSGDKADAQKKFAEKNNFPFTLLADSDSKVADAFGVPHNGPIAKRQSFLVKDGKIAWTMLAASTDTHGPDVLKAFDSLIK